jgi:hypothetical protein
MEIQKPESDKEELGKIVTEHGGMISKGMANDILEKRRMEVTGVKVSIKDILEGKIRDGQPVILEDRIYRIFNKTTFKKDNRERQRRDVVIGIPPESLIVTFWDKYAEMVDLLFIGRGDKMLAENLKLKKGMYGYELSTMANTYLAQLSRSNTDISDFSTFHAGDKEIDIIGKIAFAGDVRYFNDLKGKQGSVSDATLSDGKKEMRLTMWGSSSGLVKGMKVGSTVKIEFATIKETALGLEISAGESSRILVTQNLQEKSKSI